MGREIVCDVRHEGKTAKVKALLETDSVILRGEIKATLPFASLKHVVATDDQLHLDDTVLDLGAHAKRWADKILNPPTLLQKLGLEAGMKIAALGFAEDEFLQGIPYDEALAEDTEYDAILFLAHTRDDLNNLRHLAPHVHRH